MTAQNPQPLLAQLKLRFDGNPHRHKNITWPQVEAKLRANQAAMAALSQMELTGGEPDVINFDKQTGQFTFCDCSAESPTGRRSLCYDRRALDARKANKPAGCAIALAESMGVQLLSEVQYRALQELGEFDTKTSSWILTPADVRSKGGALFCDRRYGRVFVYHNGADSYYAVRGFRTFVLV